MAKPQFIGAGNSSDYFEKGRGLGSDYDKGANQYTDNLKLKDGYSTVAHQDAPEPIGVHRTKTAKKGGGYDYGEKQYIYKKVKQKEAPAQQAAAEPEKPKEDMVIKDRGSVEYSPEMQQAKERTQKFVGAIDGNAGSNFDSVAPDASTAPVATAQKEAALAKIDTQAYNPNPGREEQAQETADKYKLNLINKGTGGQSNFSGV